MHRVNSSPEGTTDAHAAARTGPDGSKGLPDVALRTTPQQRPGCPWAGHCGTSINRRRKAINHFSLPPAGSGGQFFPVADHSHRPWAHSRDHVPRCRRAALRLWKPTV